MKRFALGMSLLALLLACPAVPARAEQGRTDISQCMAVAWVVSEGVVEFHFINMATGAAYMVQRIIWDNTREIGVGDRACGFQGFFRFTPAPGYGFHGRLDLYGTLNLNNDTVDFQKTLGSW